VGSGEKLRSENENENERSEMGKITITIEGKPIEEIFLEVTFKEALPFTPFYHVPQKKSVRRRALRRSKVRKINVEDYLKEMKGE
jgi:hypothetical protein